MNNYGLIALSDIQLAQAAREDAKAEETLLRRVYPKIFHVAWAAIGNRELAEDATQIAALEILKSLHTFRGIGSLESWSGRIAHRVSSRIIQKERPKERRLLSLDFIEAIEENEIDDTQDTENYLVRKKLFQTFLDKLEVVPQNRRIALLLHLAYGYTVQEVAELTNVSPNTVKDRLRTAYKELRSILKDHPELQAAILEEIS
ncbi:MAG: sigma-70 family RNA polymerase sigma factor [Deltaproteobacteria bacterium]|nr:sigma-70 family RNA polymerase sigma factor [Deltaproteobacteria bacterium]